MSKQKFRLKSYLNEKKDLINTNLLKILSLHDNKRELIDAMEYSLMANGKRLRPILCIASAQCIGNLNEKSIEATIIPACAIEMIHTYSLIHDDLPAMDNDDLRRGKPTSHKKFSEATAILAGDALLTHAFLIISNISSNESINITADTVLRIITIISDAAGTNGMIEGQMLDMQANQKFSLEYLKKMDNLKTGKLIQASIETGAVIAQADSAQIKNLLCYAKNIGMAFQIVDDILDIEGDSSVIGKPVGSDISNQKLTFPQIIGLEESKKYAKDLISNAIEKLEIFNEQALPLRKIAKYIIERKY